MPLFGYILDTLTRPLIHVSQVVFDTASKKTKAGKGGFRDEEFYMSHYQKDADTEKGCVWLPFLTTHLFVFCFADRSLLPADILFATVPHLPSKRAMSRSTSPVTKPPHRSASVAS